MATNYYTYKSQVSLKPGQTLGYTPGKGYYAKGTPTPASKGGAGQSASASSSGGSTQQPASSDDSPGKATGDTSESVASATQIVAKHAIQPVAAAADFRPKTSVTDYYTWAYEVPLLPGQALGFTPGKGYYAKGTPLASAAEITAAHSAPGTKSATPLPRQPRSATSSPPVSESPTEPNGVGTSGATIHGEPSRAVTSPGRKPSPNEDKHQPNREILSKSPSKASAMPQSTAFSVPIPAKASKTLPPVLLGGVEIKTTVTATATDRSINISFTRGTLSVKTNQETILESQIKEVNEKYIATAAQALAAAKNIKDKIVVQKHFASAVLQLTPSGSISVSMVEGAVKTELSVDVRTGEAEITTSTSQTLPNSEVEVDLEVRTEITPRAAPRPSRRHPGPADDPATERTIQELLTLLLITAGLIGLGGLGGKGGKPAPGVSQGV